MKSVTVYTTQACNYCRRAEHLLKTKGVPFTQVDVTDDDEMRVKLVEMSGGRRTVPQIFIDGVAIGGFTDMAALDREKKLDAMLGL